MARNKGIEFSAEVAGETPTLVHADPLRLEQVLLNLLGNAIKFTERGWVRLHVSLPPLEEPSLLFRVSDTGIGIPPDKTDKIFQPFRQADGSMVRRFGGSGLGLAISRQLVEMMGGQIWFESTPGQGSTFFFTVRFTAASPACQTEHAPALPGERAPVSPLRVLVAEDNAVNQKLIRLLLEKQGHQVSVVDSGRCAVAAFQSDAFDLVLMDIQMPEMDGFEATAAIRALEHGRGRRVPIVALTAHAQVGYDRLCVQAGMDSYLTKPVDRAQLVSLLASISQAQHRCAGTGPAAPQGRVVK